MSNSKREFEGEEKGNGMDSSPRINYSTRIHISYGLGGFFDNFLTAAFTIRIIGFYEDEILLPIVLVGIAFFLYGIWNMFNDPFAGSLSDRNTRFTKRWGRRFPWFIISGILCAISYIFIFTVPNTETLTAFFWLLITICIFDFMFSLWMTNWLALFPDKFRSDKERTKVGGFSTVFGQLGIAFGMLVPPLFITYGNIESYITSAIIVVLIGVFIILLMIPGMHEDKDLRDRALLVANERDNSESLFQILKFAIKQKNFIVYLIAYLAQLVLMVLMLGSVYYLVRYVLGMPAEVEMIISAAFLVGSLISVPLWVWLGRKLGNRKVYLIGTSVVVVILTPLLFVSDIIAVVISTILVGIGIGALWTLMYPCFSDVIDEIVVKTGKRQEGIYTGIRTFFGRLSIVVQAISIAVVHELTSFIPGAETQTDLALWGIRVILALIPIIFYIVAFFFIWKVYDLTPEKVHKIQVQLKELNL